MNKKRSVSRIIASADEGPKGVMRLIKPLWVNNAKLDEIPYDYDALTVEDLIAANRNRAALTTSSSLNQKLDPQTQLEIFCLAVEKADPRITREDLRRLSLKDGMNAQELTLGFFLTGLGGEPETSSDETSPSSDTSSESPEQSFTE